MSDTALDMLIKARAKIADPKDWGQGMRRDRENFESCCASEAIEEPGFRTYIPMPERARAFRALSYAAGIDGAIYIWNDAPERTHREVLAAFNLAIAILRLR